MRHYIGIDLGTTNSAICSFDGSNTRIWKSPEQNDVTPSAIYIDRRGNRYFGSKAYSQAPYNPTNSATLFKRFMGTSTKIDFEAAHLSLTPEECSAEVLKVLFGYLPEEIRNDPETATVITVPDAFNQMKKDATLQAAKLAGIGNVALMQEPVAAIMSVMRNARSEGIFLIYDLGGGTFDVSIAESINGKVNLLAHGGVEMCGGRDIDRMLFHQNVVPWLHQNFSLPEDFLVNPKYKTFCRVAQWATERAKIELSSSASSTIALSEGEARTTDEDGNELYLDIDLNREVVDALISDLVLETVAATRETLTKAGLSSNDVERIVFVGGPTNYKPLRDRVAYELALPVSLDVNPMTAVAEGASIFAESIDWSSETHNRKSSNQITQSNIGLSFKYTARTSGDSARVMCVLENNYDGYSIVFVSKDSGWSSGNISLINNAIVTLPLAKSGNNEFSIRVLDPYGRAINTNVSSITITKTLATIGAIPASHSIGVEVIDKIGGTPSIEFLVTEGDFLPHKGSKVFKAGQTLKAGSGNALNIKLWEGNIAYPITDNRLIGSIRIAGTDFASGMIPTGADIECDYEISDSGTIHLEVSVPCIGASFEKRNFYSRQDGQTDLTDIDAIATQGQSVIARINSMSERVNDPKLDEALRKAEGAATLDCQYGADLEDAQKASNDLLEAKKLMNQVRLHHLKDIRQMDLDRYVHDFNTFFKQYATDAEIQSFANMTKNAQRAIDHNDSSFDGILEDMHTRITVILLRQEWFVADWYKTITKNSADYLDLSKYQELKRIGDQALAAADIDKVREIIFELLDIRIHKGSDDAMFAAANIIRG